MESGTIKPENQLAKIVANSEIEAEEVIQKKSHASID
jgi:hypothetical protein